MKRRLFGICRALLIALVLIGLDQLVEAIWVGLVRSRTINGWCNTGSLRFLVGYAPLIWLQIPSWAIMLFAGILVGLKRPCSWLRDGVLLALLFAVGSCVLPRLIWGSVIPMPTLELWLLEFSSLPLILTAAFVSQRVVQRRLSHCDDHQHCRGCDYDLHRNTSGICPECGTPLPRDKKEPKPTTDPPKE